MWVQAAVVRASAGDELEAVVQEADGDAEPMRAAEARDPGPAVGLRRPVVGPGSRSPIARGQLP